MFKDEIISKLKQNIGAWCVLETSVPRARALSLYNELSSFQMCYGVYLVNSFLSFLNMTRRIILFVPAAARSGMASLSKRWGIRLTAFPHAP